MIVHPETKVAKPKLGPFLRKQRAKQKVSMREVCRRADLNPSVVSRIEDGQFLPSMNTILKMAKVLQLDINKLIRYTTHDTKLKKRGIK